MRPAPAGAESPSASEVRLAGVPSSLDPAILAEVQTVREYVGVWISDDHTFLRITGKDAATWLQTQTSNDVLALKPGQGHLNTHLDRKGRLVAHFTLHRWEDEFWLIVEKQRSPALLQSFDDHLFLEEVQIADAGGEVEQLLLQGPRSLPFLARLLDLDAAAVTPYLPSEPYAVRPIELLGRQLLALRLSVTGEDGFLFIAPAGEAQALMDGLVQKGGNFQVKRIGRDAAEILRIEAGIPRFGLDMDTTYRVSETPLEREAVSYTKGCYVGQEVVARLKTYGSVKQALMGLAFVNEPSEALPRNAEIVAEGEKVGELKSSAYSPTLKQYIALAYLDRNHRTPDQNLEFTLQSGGPVLRAQVVALPFYNAPTSEESARQRYDQALQLFQADAKDQDTRAIDLLEEALLLAPTYEDAYEALGVILNRHGRVDEAIHYMKTLARLNPDCIMAHTNLSVFYVAKGMIAEAEDEKAKAAVLQIKATSDAHRAEEMAAAERERIRREADERIQRFREVLDIDPDDPLATFGMGTAYMQLGDYPSAVPHLQRATQVQKDYSAAYLQLGKCHEFLRQLPEACAAYREGIATAARKGDLMPLREMERRLKALEMRVPSNESRAAREATSNE
ncbi:MAG: tetratricopeptide repeat protein [Candidatus Hydrogenedentes bacterium]|nr:tetratricopeptide repeat protein [Candidatus Hydrogenedentota bacterium]